MATRTSSRSPADSSMERTAIAPPLSTFRLSTRPTLTPDTDTTAPSESPAASLNAAFTWMVLPSPGAPRSGGP